MLLHQNIDCSDQSNMINWFLCISFFNDDLYIQIKVAEEVLNQSEQHMRIKLINNASCGHNQRERY